ncbi:MAG: helix-turn-helix domain-containing protein [Chitinophagales bacterium]|nr:helix-turn-helix domain-containing protein [Chitinophagales bacterium]
MPTGISIGNLIILVGAVQGVFLSVILWNLRSGNKLSHRLLAAFLFVFALEMMYFVIWDSRMILKAPHFSMVLSPLDFAIGPLFYLYALTLTRKNFALKRIHLLHFLLVLAGFIYFLKFYMQPAVYKYAYNLQSYSQMPDLWQTFSIISTVQTSVYLALTVLLLLQHVRRVKKYYSSIEEIDLGWIRNLLLIIAFGFISCSAITVIGWKWANYYSNIVFSFSIYAMGYYGMRQKSIFADIHEEIQPQEAEPLVLLAEQPEVIAKKYERSGLTEDKAAQYLTSLHLLMEKEKPYLNPELTLQQLADQMQISLHHLSQILNQHKQQNFFDFINQLRVEEFKERLADPSKQHYSLLALAFDCGFNSKAAFNAAFKKHTGTTPSAYRKNLSISTA